MRKYALFLAIILAGISCTSTMEPTFPRNVTPEVFHAPPPQKAIAMWQQAENLEHQKMYMAAINIYRQIANEFSTNAIAPRALMKVAEILAKQSRWSDVLTYCSFITSNYPQWRNLPKTYLLAMKANTFLGNPHKALELKNKVPDTPEKYLYSALSYSSLGRLNDSIVSFEEFINKSMTTRGTNYDEYIKTCASTMSHERLRIMLQGRISNNMRYFLHCVLAQMEIDEGKEEDARKRLESLQRSLSSAHPLQPAIRNLLKNIGGTMYGKETLEAADISKIGLIIPLDGRFETYGRKLLRGISLAISEWNRNHHEDQIKLVVKNTSGDPSMVLKTFREMVHEEKVLALLGPLGKSNLNVLLDEPEAESILIMAFTADMPRQNSTIFHLRMMPDTATIVEAITRYAIEELNLKKLAILYPKDPYGQKARDLFESAVLQLNGAIVSSASYLPETTDFKSAIKQLIPGASSKRQNVTVPFEAIFVPDDIKTVSLIAPQLLYYNVVGIPLLGTNLWEHPKLGNLSNGYMDGSYYATPYFTWSDDPESSRFRSKFNTFFGNWPGFLEAQGYDTMRLLLALREAILLNQSPSRRSLINMARGFQFRKTITGIKQINEDGFIKRSVKIIGIKGDRPVQVYP